MLNLRSLLQRLILGILFTWLFTCSTSSRAAEEELPGVEVTGRPYGEEIIGPYHQPRWSARGRFSAETDVYVLPPFSFYLDADYHGTFPRRGKPDNLFIQEYEIGLPYRFQAAFELFTKHGALCRLLGRFRNRRRKRGRSASSSRRPSVIASENFRSSEFVGF